MLRGLWLEIAFALAAASFLYAWFRMGLLAELGLGLVALALGSVVALRWARILIRQLIWRLRNRLIVAYLFIAVIPIIVVFLITIYGAKHLGGQVAVYLVNAELDRRVRGLHDAAASIAGALPQRRGAIIDRMESMFSGRFPDLQVMIEDAATGPEGGWGEASGIVVRGQLLYTWARAVHESTRVTLAAPVTRRWLAGLTPGLGSVSIIHFPDAGNVRRVMLLHDSKTEDDDSSAAIPPPVNRFDFEVLWGSEIPVSIWESPRTVERALLGVRSRFSAVLNVLFSLKGEAPLAKFLYGLGVVLVIVYIISIYIGVTVTRSITGAVHDLYQGTERVMQGDFSHRIEVRGDDQIAELSGSFNRMTGNIERLLQVAKEKERIEAEIEIARHVQAQLFPRAAPVLEHLDLKAVCHPARMVSGDYYDYQALGDGRLVLALGDVAGKGISAALLMASLQTCLRMQVRDALETASANQGAPVVFSTSRTMMRINHQLWENTAPEKYATFCFGVYDDASGSFIYTNAGHLPPILIRGGEAVTLDVNGMVVGAFRSARYDESRLVLERGDLLVAYTDGITEPENEYGEMFGDGRLVETVLKAADKDPSAIIDTVIDAVHAFTGSPELQDDMTMIVARRL